MQHLATLSTRKTRRIVGLMSGTSADGVDACVAELTGRGAETVWKVLAHDRMPYTPELRRAVLEASEAETGRTDLICALNFVLGEVFAEAAMKAIRRAGMVAGQIDLIASHGQTIHHLPGNRVIGGYSTPSTLQIGEPCVIAERTGIPVVADFRVRDVAAGGLGAPLVPFADRILFQRDREAVAVQNIGGIANVTVLPARESGAEVVGFDTGPGNMIIDAVVHDQTLGAKTMDTGGAIASSGRVDESLVERLLEDEFVNRPPPKAAGREQYGREFFRTVSTLSLFGRVKGADLVATVTAFTAAAIARNYEKFIFPAGRPAEVIVCGGGSRNAFLLARLRQELEGVPVVPIEERGVASEAKEALSFAILGNESICGAPSNLPSVTGARRPVILGKFVP